MPDPHALQGAVSVANGESGQQQCFHRFGDQHNLGMSVFINHLPCPAPLAKEAGCTEVPLVVASTPSGENHNGKARQETFEFELMNLNNWYSGYWCTNSSEAVKWRHGQRLCLHMSIEYMYYMHIGSQ